MCREGGMNSTRCRLVYSDLALVIITSAKEDMCFRRCLFVCLSVSLLATLRKNFQTDVHESFGEGWPRANEQTAKFWR